MTGDNSTTTVQITKGDNSTKDLLDDLKVHDKQPYDELIHELAKKELMRREDHK